MRVAYFVNHYPVQNQPVFEDEALVLLQLGHEIVIVPVWGALAGAFRVPDALRARILPVPGPTALRTVWRNALSALRSPSRYIAFIQTARRHIGLAQTLSAVALAGQLRARRIDRIHGHFASTGALRGLLTAEWLGVPFSCTGHGTDILIHRPPFLPLLLKKSTPFITVSEYNRQRLRADIEAARTADIRVVRCGVNLAYFRQGAPDPDNPATPTVLSVSWFRTVKGLAYLVEACALLRDRGLPFRCVIVGGGEQRPDVEQQIARCALEGRMTLTGPLDRSQVLGWYRSADIFTLPSLSEGIPVSLMEAMAMGLPVVATRITGIPELVDAGVDGLLVEPGDARALADALADLLTHPERRRALGRCARKKIEEKYDLQKNVAQLAGVFSETRLIHLDRQKGQPL